MKQERRWLTIGLAALALAGCMARSEMENVSVTQLRKQKGAPVKVVRAQKKTLPIRLSVAGTVLAPEEVNLTPQVGGKLVAVYKDKGDSVREGEALAQIEQLEYQLGVFQAESALKTAELQLEMARNGARSEELDQAKNSLATAEAEAVRADKNYKRVSDLFEQGVISRQALDSAEMERVAAERQSDSAKKQLEMAQGGAREEEIDLLETQVQMAKAALAARKLALDRSTIRSPCDGVIAYRMANAGESVGTSDALYQILKGGPLKVAFSINEKDLDKLHVGDVARFWPEGAGPDDASETKISYISNFVNKTTRQADVEALVETSGSALAHGMFVEGEIQVGQMEGIVVPYKALVENRSILLVQDGKAVSRLCSDVKRVAEYSRINGDCAKEGDLIVVEGQGVASDGDKVNILEYVDY